MSGTVCRFCATPLREVFADLGMSPLANSYLRFDELARMEPFFPLKALVCERCFLVQLEDYETREAIFSDDYAYFSSFSKSWLDHARRYADAMTTRLALGAESLVVEIASNDGYLLQYFSQAGVPVLGVEPAGKVARAAQERGVPTEVRFFGVETAQDLVARKAADLLVGNNVLAHVPDLNDFVAGMSRLLADGGTLTMEFPHLMHLIDDEQFDTIYHEHFSYFSFTTARRLFAAHGLELFDAEELPTHGGSLRIFGRHATSRTSPGRDDLAGVSDTARELLEREEAAGYSTLEPYRAFGSAVHRAKLDILDFLVGLRRQGLRIAGYGAPAKANTLLNYCGIGPEIIAFTVDRNPHKQGRFLPGTHIPIRPPEAIFEERPDVVVILPWNLLDEVTEQMAGIRQWGGRFAARAPELRLLP